MFSASQRSATSMASRPARVTRTQHHKTEIARAKTCMYSPKAPPANVAKLPPTNAKRRSLVASSIDTQCSPCTIRNGSCRQLVRVPQHHVKRRVMLLLLLSDLDEIAQMHVLLSYLYR